MKYGKIIDIIKERNIVIPMYIYKLFPKLNIELDEFLFLMYLNTKGNNILFNVKSLADEFFCEIKTIMKYISTLQEKKLIELKVVKNENNIMDEYISLDLFYEKISMDLIDTFNKKEESNSTIFGILEQELGKQLTPIEYEIVKAWKESNYSDEIVKEAIREAVLNNVPSLRYIDKILYEWAKKNIKTKEDVERNRKQFKEKDKMKPIKLDLFDYDWMDETDGN